MFHLELFFSGVPKRVVSRLQLVQNTATRILTKTRKGEHFTPVLASLHWLPVQYRTDFKILLLTYKALNGLAPGYLHVRDAGLLVILMFNKSNTGGRAFSCRALNLWNALPSFREAGTITV